VYLFLGADMLSSRTYRALNEETKLAEKYYSQDEKIDQDMKTAPGAIRGQYHYLSKSAGFPFYRNEQFDYYPLADIGYPVMLEEMKKAKKFIFLEYFIVEEGTMWNQMVDILKAKAREGLDVRVLYDDLGSLMTLPTSYASTLEKEGIKCTPFNRINPIIGIIANHRDHRKIMVIDGETAFSGGSNLADEYINVKVIHGHWKDNIIRIKGEAVWSYTVLFLTHWNALRKTDNDFRRFRAEKPVPEEHDGWIAPYGDTPLDDELTGQSVYLNMINHASKYLYIMTPYLIIDSDMTNMLMLAAKRGVDVRIITPGIPDKKIVWEITRSYYPPLIKAGVKIYEYTPGFVHSKVFVSDDREATVGTINLDYRSLYLHFENGTYLYRASAIEKIREDFENTNRECRRIAMKDIRSNVFKSLLIDVLRIFAPQM
jgi:cardiolipin synthase